VNNITSRRSNATDEPPPPEAVEFIVICPVLAETVILVPATIEVTIPVRFVPEPLKEVAVTIPTLRLGVPDNPVAVPVRFPEKPEVAVSIPVTVKPSSEVIIPKLKGAASTHWELIPLS
jgi:hypothetical protein